MAAPFEDGVATAFRDHSASIERLALRSTRDPELAADVTQEAFLRLLLEAREGRFPDNVGGWLYRTSANLIASHARHSAVERRWAPNLARPDEPIGPDAMVAVREEHRAVIGALASLSGADQAVLAAAARGATGAELARDLGRSPGATRTLLCRARMHLRMASISYRQPEGEV